MDQQQQPDSPTLGDSTNNNGGRKKKGTFFGNENDQQQGVANNLSSQYNMSSSMLSASSSTIASPTAGVYSQANIHPSSVDRARAQEEVEFLKQRLFSGQLLSHQVNALVYPEEGLARKMLGDSVNGKAGSSGKGFGKNREVQAHQDRWKAVERSKEITELHQKRAEEALKYIHESLKVAKQHDEHGVIGKVQGELHPSWNLAQYVLEAQARLKEHGTVNQRTLNSQMANFERMNLFELEADEMHMQQLLTPDLELEGEVREMCTKFGLQDPETGKWKPSCDCESKLQVIKQVARKEEKRIAKARYVTQFVKELDHLVGYIDTFVKDTKEMEDARLKEILEVREKQFMLLSKVQAQQLQIEKLRQRLKTAGLKLEEVEAEKDNINAATDLKDYVQYLEKEKNRKLQNEKQFVPRKKHKKFMNRLMAFTCNNEKALMAQFDYDGYVDPAYEQYLEMRKKLKKVEDISIQTMTEEDLFMEHGIMPQSMQRRAAGATSLPVPKLAIPAFLPEKSDWVEELKPLEQLVTQLTTNFSNGIDSIEQFRYRVMTAVANHVVPETDMETELQPIFGHTTASLKDTYNKMSLDAKLSQRKISAAAKQLIDRAVQAIDESWKKKEKERIDAEGGAEEKEEKKKFAEFVAKIEQEQAEKEEKEAEKTKKSFKKIAEVVVEKNKSSKGNIKKEKSQGSMKQESSSPKKEGAKSSKNLKKEANQQQESSTVLTSDAEKELPLGLSMSQKKASSKKTSTSKKEISFLETIATTDSPKMEESLLLMSPKSRNYEEDVHQMRQMIIEASKELVHNDVLTVKRETITALENCEDTESVVAVVGRWVSEVRDAAVQQGVEPKAPGLLTDSMEPLRKTIQDLCQESIKQGLTFPSFVLPEIDSMYIFNESTTVMDLVNCMSKSESHLKILSNAVKRQIPDLLQKEKEPYESAIVEVSKAVKEACTQIKETFPKLYIDTPISSLFAYDADRIEKNCLKVGTMCVEALDNLQYFLREMKTDDEKNFDTAARKRAQEMASDVYAKMVQESDKVALQETQRANKAKKEADEKIRLEKQRYQEMIDAEKQKLDELQKKNSDRMAEQDKSTQEVLKLQEEMVELSKRRAERAKTEADHTVESEEKRVADVRQYAEETISAEEAKLIAAHAKIFEKAFEKLIENEDGNRQLLSNMEETQYQNFLGMVGSVFSTIIQAQKLLEEEEENQRRKQEEVAAQRKLLEEERRRREEAANTVDVEIDSEEEGKEGEEGPSIKEGKEDIKEEVSKSIVDDGLSAPVTPEGNISLQPPMLPEDQQEHMTPDEKVLVTSTKEAGVQFTFVAPTVGRRSQTDAVQFYEPVKKKNVGINVRLTDQSADQKNSAANDEMIATLIRLKSEKEEFASKAEESDQRCAEVQKEIEALLLKLQEVEKELEEEKQKVAKTMRNEKVATLLCESDTDEKVQQHAEETSTTYTSTTVEKVATPTTTMVSPMKSDPSVRQVVEAATMTDEVCYFDYPTKNAEEGETGNPKEEEKQQQVVPPPEKEMIIPKEKQEVIIKMVAPPKPVVKDAAIATEEKEMTEEGMQANPNTTETGIQECVELIDMFTQTPKKIKDTPQISASGEVSHALFFPAEIRNANAMKKAREEEEAENDFSSPPVVLQPSLSISGFNFSIVHEADGEEAMSEPGRGGKYHSHRSQTDLEFTEIVEMEARPSWKELLSIGRSIADINSVFLALVPGASDVTMKSMNIGGEMLSSWELCLSQFYYYLQDLRLSRSKSKKDILPEAKKIRHVPCQANPTTRSVGLQVIMIAPQSRPLPTETNKEEGIVMKEKSRTESNNNKNTSTKKEEEEGGKEKERPVVVEDGEESGKGQSVEGNFVDYEVDVETSDRKMIPDGLDPNLLSISSPTHFEDAGLGPMSPVKMVNTLTSPMSPVRQKSFSNNIQTASLIVSGYSSPTDGASSPQYIARPITPTKLKMEQTICETQAAALQLHETLLSLLPEMLKKWKLTEYISTENPFPGMFGGQKAPSTEILDWDTKLLKNIQFYLQQQKASAVKKTVSASFEEAAISKKLESFLDCRKKREFPEDLPQVAAFLDRQEKKLREAMEKYKKLKDEALEDREAAIRSYFLPTKDIPAVSYMPQVMQKRKVYGGGVGVNLPIQNPPAGGGALSPQSRVKTPVEINTAVRCGPIAVQHFEPDQHPANVVHLKRSVFLQPLHKAPSSTNEGGFVGAITPPPYQANAEDISNDKAHIPRLKEQEEVEGREETANNETSPPPKKWSQNLLPPPGSKSEPTASFYAPLPQEGDPQGLSLHKAQSCSPFNISNWRGPVLFAPPEDEQPEDIVIRSPLPIRNLPAVSGLLHHHHHHRGVQQQQPAVRYVVDNPNKPPVTKHIVLPRRSTQVQPDRDFFMHPLAGHQSKIFQVVEIDPANRQQQRTSKK